MDNVNGLAHGKLNKNTFLVCTSVSMGQTVTGRPFVPEQGQEQMSQEKPLCPGTSRDKITFLKETKNRKRGSKTGKGRSKNRKESSKAGKDVLKKEKYVLKQEIIGIVHLMYKI